MQDALHNGDPADRGNEVDRPLESSPRREHEAGRDHDDALGPGAETDVATETERFGLRADVGDEEGAGDRDDREERREVVAAPREHVADGCEHRALADAVGCRIEEGTERRRLPAGARERTVEDVEDRADHEDDRGEPVEEDLVPVLEGNEHGRDQAQADAGGRQGIRGDARPREALHRAAREPACTDRISRLDPLVERPGDLAVSQSCYGATIARLRYVPSPRPSQETALRAISAT